MSLHEDVINNHFILEHDLLCMCSTYDSFICEADSKFKDQIKLTKYICENIYISKHKNEFKFDELTIKLYCEDYNIENTIISLPIEYSEDLNLFKYVAHSILYINECNIEFSIYKTILDEVLKHYKNIEEQNYDKHLMGMPKNAGYLRWLLEVKTGYDKQTP